MPHDTGSLSAGDRLERLEDIHAPGGPCEDHRAKCWRKLDELTERLGVLSERLTRLEVKILAVLIVGQAVATVLVQVALAVWKGKGG